MTQPLWLTGTLPFPGGGVTVQVEYRSGRGEGGFHLTLLNPLIAPLLGCSEGLFRGSMNLHADAAVALPEPLEVPLHSFTWLFVPVILEERAIGLVARRGDSGDSSFLEVFACEKLAHRLGAAPGDRLVARLLSGRYLITT